MEIGNYQIESQPQDCSKPFDSDSMPLYTDCKDEVMFAPTLTSIELESVYQATFKKPELKRRTAMAVVKALEDIGI